MAKRRYTGKDAGQLHLEHIQYQKSDFRATITIGRPQAGGCLDKCPSLEYRLDNAGGPCKNGFNRAGSATSPFRVHRAGAGRAGSLPLLRLRKNSPKEQFWSNLVPVNLFLQ